MKLIAAVSESWGIGYNNQLLYHIPNDMKFFKEKTTGKTVLMGRKTYESIGKPLSNRQNIVVTRSSSFCEHGIIQITDLSYLPDNTENIFCIGGSMLYNTCLDMCNTAHITKIFDDKKADAFFPNLDEDDNWYIAETSAIHEHNGLKYQFITYKRKHKI